jgi:hypothetical protein
VACFLDYYFVRGGLVDFVFQKVERHDKLFLVRIPVGHKAILPLVEGLVGNLKGHSLVGGSRKQEVLVTSIGWAFDTLFKGAHETVTGLQVGLNLGIVQFKTRPANSCDVAARDSDSNSRGLSLCECGAEPVAV